MTPVISKFGNLLLNGNSPIYAPAAGHVNRPKSALVFDQNCLRDATDLLLRPPCNVHATSSFVASLHLIWISRLANILKAICAPG